MINRSTLKAALRSTPECLTVQELERLAEDPSPKHPHLAKCPRCQAELTLLKEFEASSPLPDEGAAVTWISAQLDRNLDQIKNPRSVSRNAQSTTATGWFSGLFKVGTGRWLVPVAAIVVVTTASLILLRPSKEPELHANLGSGQAIYRSQQVEVVSPIGELAGAPNSLQWKGFPGAAEYKVEIMEVDHAPLWSAKTNDISITIPSATRAKMLPGKPVIWQATALDSQGRTLAVSQLERFSVIRKSPILKSGSNPK
jgi:hypothetical protein